MDELDFGAGVAEFFRTPAINAPPSACELLRTALDEMETEDAAALEVV